MLFSCRLEDHDLHIFVVMFACAAFDFNLVTSNLILTSLEKTQYEELGNGTKCENEQSIYTKSDQNYCNGWKGISLEECKTKCTINEVPNIQCLRQGVQCAYIQYNHDWGCQLADKTCNPIRADPKYNLIRKQG